MSRTRDAALTAFIARKAGIDAALGLGSELLAEDREEFGVNRAGFPGGRFTIPQSDEVERGCAHGCVRDEGPDQRKL